MAPGPLTIILRRHVMAVASVLLLTLSAGAIGWFLVWRSSDKKLFPGGDLLGVTVPVGRTVYVGLGIFAAHTPQVVPLDIESVTPRTARNTAAASITVLRCRQSSDETGEAGLGVGGTAYNPRHVCTSLTPFRPGIVAIGSSRDGLVAAITARRPGVLRVQGWQVKYQDGWRTGNQVAGIYDRVVSVTHATRQPSH